MEPPNVTSEITESSIPREGEQEDPQPSAMSNPLDRLFPAAPKPQPIPKQHVQPTTKRQGPKSMATPKGIPNTWEEAGELDRMLVTMRAEGKMWPEVRDAWTAKSGEKPGTSTLPNRFRRIAANLMWGKENMEKHLENSIAEVEARFEAEKWAQIAELVKTKSSGSYSYPPEFLQKKAQDAKIRAKKIVPIAKVIVGDRQTSSIAPAVDLTMPSDGEEVAITVSHAANDHTHAETLSPTPVLFQTHNDTLSEATISNDPPQLAVSNRQKSVGLENHQSPPRKESLKSTQPPLHKIGAKRIKRKSFHSPVSEAASSFSKYLDKNPCVGRYVSVTEENGPWRRTDGGKVPWRRKAYILTKCTWNALLNRWTRLGRPMAGELEIYPSILAVQRRRPELTLNVDSLISTVESIIGGIPRDDIRKAAHLWKRFDLGKLDPNNDELWTLDTEPLDVAKNIAPSATGHNGPQTEELAPLLVESEPEENEEFCDADETSHVVAKSNSRPAPQANMSHSQPTPRIRNERSPASFMPFINDLYDAAFGDPVEENGDQLGHAGDHVVSQRSSISPDSALLDPALRGLPKCTTASTANSNELPVVRMLENADILSRDLKALIRAATSTEKGRAHLRDLRSRIDNAGNDGQPTSNNQEVSSSLDAEDEETVSQPGEKRRRLA